MNILKKALSALFPRYKRTYAQSGEDIIIAGIMKSLGKGPISYLDIGAYHPTHLSNTYYFYENGGSGVCVEPNPALFGRIRKERPRDTCLNVGIGTGQTEQAAFYVMDPPTLSTFSKEEADTVVREKSAILTATRTVRLETINSIIERHFPSAPDLVSLDVEGLDADILRTFDFRKCRPAVFCVETISYSPSGGGKKDREIFEIMERNGYRVHADTYVNTIFTDNARP